MTSPLESSALVEVVRWVETIYGAPISADEADAQQRLCAFGLVESYTARAFMRNPPKQAEA